MSTSNTADNDAALNEREVAKILSVSVRTVQHWRTTGEGPPFMRFGRLIRYGRPALFAWMTTKIR